VIIAIMVVGSFNLALGFSLDVACDHSWVRTLWGAAKKPVVYYDALSQSGENESNDPDVLTAVLFSDD
jgi:hypothetical protein